MLQNLNSNAWIGMDMTDGRVRWLDGEPLKMIRFGPDNRVIRIGGDRHIFQNVGQAGFSNEVTVCFVLHLHFQFSYCILILLI